MPNVNAISALFLEICFLPHMKTVKKGSEMDTNHLTEQLP